MERSLRRKEYVPIIEISDSEDGDKNTLADDSYHPDDSGFEGTNVTGKKAKPKNVAEMKGQKKKRKNDPSPKKEERKAVKRKLTESSDPIDDSISISDNESIDSKEAVKKTVAKRAKKSSTKKSNNSKSSIDLKTEDNIKNNKKKTRKTQTSVKEEKELHQTDFPSLDFKKESKDVAHNQKHKAELGSAFTSVELKEWTIQEYISEIYGVEERVVEKVIKLFDEDNTIPFIARYRKAVTNSMEADKLRAIKNSLDQAKEVKHRATTILQSIDKMGHWTPELYSAIKSIKSLEELEEIYSIYKPPPKQSPLQKAIELGLQPIADKILKGLPIPPLTTLIDSRNSLMSDLSQISNNIMHILVDGINKNKKLFDKVKELQDDPGIEIQSTHHQKTKAEQAKFKKMDEEKYERYRSFRMRIHRIRPHQVLAINRGEANKHLTVAVNIPDYLVTKFKRYCENEYRPVMNRSKDHARLLYDAIDFFCKQRLKALLVRRVRAELKKKAQEASIEVFATNVKQLLLVPPVRGKIVLGIDPGFTNGCKLAVVSEQGNVLDTGVIYPHKKSSFHNSGAEKGLVELVMKHNCTTIAVGNATACRETERFLAELIKSGAFGPLKVSYAIVNEAGASIYSCSSEAKAEFPHLDSNLISAVSIARRLQDPLAELVKVEPKHLGVGMYQHDVPEKQLMLTLNEVVSEAVSFVGVDINTASHCLLRRVAGLGPVKATNILDWRNDHGPFKNRQQLLDVKGIGVKTFEQCAGFIRVLPETAMTLDFDAKASSSKGRKNMPNWLDQTWIHPESYSIAHEFLKYCNCNLKDLGTPGFIEKIKSRIEEGYAALAKRFGTNEETMEVIAKGLSMEKDKDVRSETFYPLFRSGMVSIGDIGVGSVLTGAVRNVTHFGAFVDVGIGNDGLIHSKYLKGNVLRVGQRVEVKVVNVDSDKVGLELMKVL